MKNKGISILIVTLLGVLLLFGCFSSPFEAKQELIKTTEWVFVKEIPLDEIAPIGIAVHGNHLWLSDVGNNRIVKVNLDGKILEIVDGFKRPMHITTFEDKVFIPEYSSDSIKILENGKVSNYKLMEQPDAIAGVAVDENNIAVADFYNNRVILQQGDKISIIGKEGHNDGELYYPTDVEIHNELIYVADAYNNRIQVFDFEGNYVKMIGWNENINVATGLKVTEKQVIVTDFNGNRVLVYDLEGNLLQILSDKFNQPTDVEIIEGIMYVINYKGKNISLYQNE